MSLPPPSDAGACVRVLLDELVGRVGLDEVVARCCALLEGAPREDHLDVLPYLTGHGWRPGDPVRDPDRWRGYWLRTWGARGLLHAWDDAATPVVLRGLGDEHWRPVEMCLKVCARHEVAGAGEPVARLVGRPEPRVRAQVARALGAVADVEHVAALRTLLVDDEPAVRAAALRAWPVAVRRLDLTDQAPHC